jgi:hypothetical protein
MGCPHLFGSLDPDPGTAPTPSNRVKILPVFFCSLSMKHHGFLCELHDFGSPILLILPEIYWDSPEKKNKL